jgi:hypothetical protein
MMAQLKVGIVDTGVNPWHSHVRGSVTGCRIRLAPDGRIEEDGDFRDPVGHGTAVAGVIREALPAAAIFAVRVFDAESSTYPSLVARGVYRAASAHCAFINLSLAIARSPGAELIVEACAAALAAGCVLVAPAREDWPDWLPAALPGVHAVALDETLADEEVRVRGPLELAAPGRPRTLDRFSRESNFSGHSFACARGLVHLARRYLAAA